VPEGLETPQQAPCRPARRQVAEKQGELHPGRRYRRRLGGGAVLLALLALWPAAASASGPPLIGEVWTASTSSSTARLEAEIDPNGLATGYHVDYIPRTTYEANVGASKDPFSGAQRLPSASEASIGTAPVTVKPQISSLSPDSAYRYRVVAKNSAGATPSPTLTFATQAIGGAALPDSRGWELVSPVDKNGGEVAAPGSLASGGVLQAAGAGGAVTYGSAASFGAGAGGAATASQYIATRNPGGWSTQNITAPLYSASYNTETEGVPYRLFSADLARGLLLNGRRCRGEGTDCAVPNPPLAGTDAPAGYQDYYLRESASGAFTALLGNANAGYLSLEPAELELRLAGSSPDLNHPVLTTCAALTANATEVPLGEGCDPAQANLYEYSPGGGLSLVNVLPAQSQGTPGATLAAPAGAVSADGSRVYFTVAGDLYLREGAATKQVDTAAGGGGAFETASSDGSVAFFSKGAHLWRYLAAGAGSASDLTPSGGVAGVLGASADASHVYYQDGAALKLWHAGTTTTVAPGATAAAASDYPPATGTARVSADGTHLLFLSTASLTGYDNKELGTGTPVSEVYLYDDGPKTLTCASCNPTFARPVGPSSIPGAIANGAAPGTTQIYKPRALSADGRRVFFDSLDAIGLADTNKDPDVYEWEAQGVGSCTRVGGCVSLLSGGKSAGGASFVDASADGSDAFFLTGGSLIGSDPGSTDLYDARVGGGFPVASTPIACKGDACQPLPSAPVDPTLTTLLSGPGNPAVRYPSARKRCKKGYVKRQGKCVKKKIRKQIRRRPTGSGR
jgi:hypothetical protein